MRLESFGAVPFEDVALSEPSEVAEAPAVPPPTEAQPQASSQTLSDMAQQLPHWVNLAPAANEVPASAAASPRAPPPPPPETQDPDAAADRSADLAFMAQHQATLASMLEQAQARLGRVDTFHHGVSEGYLDYASEMEFDAATTEVQRLEAEMAEGYGVGVGDAELGEPVPMDFDVPEPVPQEPVADLPSTDIAAAKAQGDAGRQEDTQASSNVSATGADTTGGQAWAAYVAAHRDASSAQQLAGLLSAKTGTGAPIDTRPSTVYVRPDDSLSKIAARFPEFGSTNDLKNQLIAANPQLRDPNSLTEGMALNFPGANTAVTNAAMARATDADGRYQTAQAFKESERRAQMLGLSGGTDPVPTDPEAVRFAAEYQARIDNGPKASAYDPRVEQARQQANQRTATSIGLAAGGMLTGWAAGAQLAGASDEVVNNLGVAQAGVILSLGGAAASFQSVTARPAMPSIPQGMTPGEFNAFSRSLDQVMTNEGLPPGQTVVQGSRASGTARLDSDIDVLHVVKDADFDALLANRLAQVQSPKIAAQITKTADLQGRLSGFQTSSTLEKSIWTEVYPTLPKDFSGTQFSVARESSSFKNGPLIPLSSSPTVPRGPMPALPASAPQP